MRSDSLSYLKPKERRVCFQRVFFFSFCVVGVFSWSQYLVVIRGTAGDSHSIEWLFSLKRMKNLLRPTLFHLFHRGFEVSFLFGDIFVMLFIWKSLKFNQNNCNYLTSLQIFFQRAYFVAWRVNIFGKTNHFQAKFRLNVVQFRVKG